MLRHLLTVIVSALIGSTVGTLIWTVFEGGTGAVDPIKFSARLAVGTLWFTIPGAVLLMAATFALASRGHSQSQAAIVLLLLGALAGAAMLALFSPYFILLGAVFGALTAAAFVCIIWMFRAYPGSNPSARP